MTWRWWIHGHSCPNPLQGDLPPEPRGGARETVRVQSGVQWSFDPDRLVEECILNSPVSVTLKEFWAACQAGNAGVPERRVGAIKRKRVVTTGLCGAHWASGSEGDDEWEFGESEAGGPVALATRRS